MSGVTDVADEFAPLDPGAADLLSSAGWEGLSDPYSVQQGGWLLGALSIDPYTNAPLSESLLAPFVGADVDPYTNLAADANANPFAGGISIDPYSGLQPASFSTGSPILAFGIDASATGAPAIIGQQSLYDQNGNWIGTQYIYDNGSRDDVMFDGSTVVHYSDLDAMVIPPITAQPITPQQPPTPVQTPSPEPPRAQELPQLPPPAQPTSPPPVAQPPAPPAPPGPVIMATEVVIVGERPFSPEISDPAALERAQGMGHIQMGDIKQFGKGAYNGLVDLLTLATKVPLPIPRPPLPPLPDLPKASIDPRYGGAAIMGEQLAQNLALEAAAGIPALGRAMTKTLGRESLVVEHVGQTPLLSEQPWAEYQRYATGTDMEEFFRITEDGVSRDRLADAKTNNFLVDAKLGSSVDRATRNAWHGEAVIKQANDYLLITDAMGYRGVRYMVSDPLRAEKLLKEFTRVFPEAVSSGQLSVWWVP
ncbi:MAG: hypothetical protein DMF88_06780 [Acidobacteria bacterium]|nr:MAG: hypothetical protein DMF88_06780 [Acidobacteriota bacterium]